MAGPAWQANPQRSWWPRNKGLPGVPVACHRRVMFIAFTNTKGGTGKSTLAAHLAIWLFDHGINVGFLDTDDQGTSSKWLMAAEPKLPIRLATQADQIQEAKRELERTCSVIVADTPGAENEASQTVPLLCDFAIVPLQPSKPDLRAIKKALRFIRIAQEMKGSPEVVLVLTFTAKSDVQTRRLRKQLAELNLPVATTEIRRLNAFRDACDSSVTRLSTREANEAARDINSLFSELLGTRVPRLFEQEASNG